MAAAAFAVYLLTRTMLPSHSTGIAPPVDAPVATTDAIAFPRFQIAGRWKLVTEPGASDRGWVEVSQRSDGIDLFTLPPLREKEGISIEFKPAPGKLQVALINRPESRQVVMCSGSPRHAAFRVV